MKKIKLFCPVFVFAIALFAAALFVGCGESQTSLYKLDLAISGNTLTGSEEVTYVNCSENALSEVHFHLYANAFRQGAESQVVSAQNYDKAYYDGESFGSICVTSATSEVEGQTSSTFCIGGEDENVLVVSLAQPIYPEESATIYIQFALTLPNVNHRFGVGENTTNLGNFYPIACVYEDGFGWHEEAYCSNGDPFYSEVASYEVSITYPAGFTLASSGEICSTTYGESVQAYISAQNVRDFAFVLCEKYSVASKTVSGVTVNYYYYDDEDYAAHLETAVLALETFGDLFGDYPYAVLSVAKASFVHGGMEYPNLVLISDEVSSEDYDYVIVHEIAHQWWYGVVGNNEYADAWLDEGLAEYSTLLFFRENEQYGLSFDTLIASAQSSYKLFVKVFSSVQGEVDTSMLRNLSEYATEPEYVVLTYTKGVLLFDTFREAVGERKFFAALRAYYKTFAYKTVSGGEFIEFMTEATSKEMEAFFVNFLQGNIALL